MKHLLHILPLLLLLTPEAVRAQHVKVVEDEECGCDIFFVDGIETTRQGDRYGFRHEDGTVLVDNIYKYVGQFQGGYCKVFLEDTLAGLIDSTGREVVHCQYDFVDFPYEGRVMVIKNARVGYCDMRGRLVVPPIFLQGSGFSEGCAPVLYSIDSFASACTYIDTTGRILFEPVFEDVLPFSCGLALVKRYARWGVMDHAGRMLQHPVFEYITTIQDTLFMAGDSSGMALFDGRLQPLTDFRYTWCDRIRDGRILAQRDGHYGYLSRQGREAIPFIFDEAGSFIDGRAHVRVGEQHGIIDTAGHYVLPLQYENRLHRSGKYVYHDGLALVEQGGRMSYVNHDGQLLMPYWFEDAYPFSEGLAAVKHNGMWGYIDTAGEVFMPFVFDLASPYSYGRAEVYYLGEQRKVDNRGRCVRNCKGIIAWRNWNE